MITFHYIHGGSVSIAVGVFTTIGRSPIDSMLLNSSEEDCMFQAPDTRTCDQQFGCGGWEWQCR